MSDVTNTKVVANPQVTFVYGTPFGHPPCCVSCEEPVHPTVGYFALWAGTTDRADLLAVAHGSLWEGPGAVESNPWCEDALRARWAELVDTSGAGVLTEDYDHGTGGFLLGGEPLTPYTPVELLTADGHWLPGWFEQQDTPTFTAVFWFALGGWDIPRVSVALPRDTLIRRAPRR